MWYFGKDGVQMGPVSWDVLVSMARGGTLVGQDLVCQEGSEQWYSAESIGGLFDPTFGQMGVAYPVNHPAPGAIALGYSSGLYPPDRKRRFNYAGFWLRAAAAILDGVILYLVAYVIDSIIVGMVILKARTASLDLQFISMVIGWLYFSLMESSKHQATFGKQMMGLRVTDMSGRRITFARATGRHFGKLISEIALFVGFMMAGWTQKKQALHDMLADCLVVRVR